MGWQPFTNIGLRAGPDFETIENDAVVIERVYLDDSIYGLADEGLWIVFFW